MIFLCWSPPSRQEQKACVDKSGVFNYDSKYLGATAKLALKIKQDRELSDKGFLVNHARVLVGSGLETFEKGKIALQNWRHFNLNWAFVDPKTPIQRGVKFCVCTKAIFPWLLMPLEVVYVDESRSAVASFSFGSGTLQGHLLAVISEYGISWGCRHALEPVSIARNTLSSQTSVLRTAQFDGHFDVVSHGQYCSWISNSPEISDKGGHCNSETNEEVFTSVSLTNLSCSSCNLQVLADGGTSFGHNKQAGEERFSITMDEKNDVWYEILSFSKPANFLSLIGYPYVLLKQKHFARDSTLAMQKHLSDK
ncbi:UNVERIFIED_CONTAM: hypothetical protein Sradi_1025300 [Sesamum radiatum]|uniref:DUF1990 domain-containing protein n=1 Tax=Sesamum radiatum TaxID=300843 RepID=A0AAW2V8S9_SESRA